MSRLEQLWAAGNIAPNERDDLQHMIEHGWVLWPGAIEPSLIDSFVADIRGVHRHPGKFVQTQHRLGKPASALNGRRPDTFESLFDLYVNLESARAVSLHPRIVRFLSLVFGSRPVINQQLLFQRSNGHRVHQDTSVVAVEDPLLLAATWIALQDVIEGSGELAYYDRSHRLPHYLFADGSKRFNPRIDNQDDYVRELRAACERAGCEYRRFMARKGDVFFWTADLVHLSHPRTMPDDTPRLSCVTHYHPATTRPYWFLDHPDHQTILTHDMIAGYVSAHYPLGDDRAGMLTPNSVGAG